MRVIPLSTSNDQCVIFIVFEDENIDRLKQHDPAEFSPIKLGHPWNRMKIKDVVLMYATPEEIAMLDKSDSPEAIKKALLALSRGWKYHPELGDHDGPYFGLRNDQQ